MKLFTIIVMKKNLMIVDDDPSILITIREIFESKDYIVYTVNSGKDCIEEIKNGFKGVILIDIMMPVMDGWETIRELKRNNLLQGVSISILTAIDDPGVDLKEFNDIIKGYITKPFDPKELISMVDNYHKNLTN